MTENEIGTIVVQAAITVHRALGPGLLMKDGITRVVYRLNEQKPLRLCASAGE